MFAHLRRILGIPLDEVVLAQDYYVALALALVRLRQQHRKDELVEVKVELLLGALVAQLVQKAALDNKTKHRRNRC